MSSILQDKKAILQVFAGLIANPHNMSKSSGYDLNVDDFPEKFHKIIYGSVINLYLQGIEKITSVEIDMYLSRFPQQYAIYESNNGMSYLDKLQEIGEASNYKHHYDRVKKFSFLRACKIAGIDISDIYDEKIVDLKDTEIQQQAFDNMTLKDMIRYINEKVLDVKEMFQDGTGDGSQKASDNVGETLEEMMKTPTYGAGLASKYLTAITRGARLSKYFLRSSITGGGKSRYALADLLTLCVPEIYDLDKKVWVKTGAIGRGLFQTTELTVDEVQIPCIAYISGVPEWKLLDGDLTQDEQERLRYAVKVLESTPLWIDHLNDFDIQQIEDSIEKHVVKYDVTYIIFDYLHSSMRILSDIGRSTGVKLREDQILLLMSDKIKQMCNKYNVWILSGTQMNNEYKTEGNLDSSSLAGAKAISNKVDVGMIMLPISVKDEKVLEEIKKTSFALPFGAEPTHTITVYKNRRGEHNFVRIWLNIDLGNLRTTDLFVTDMEGRIIDIQPKKVVLMPVKAEPLEEESDSLPDSFDF